MKHWLDRSLSVTSYYYIIETFRSKELRQELHQGLSGFSSTTLVNIGVTSPPGVAAILLFVLNTTSLEELIMPLRSLKLASYVIGKSILRTIRIYKTIQGHADIAGIVLR